MLNMLIKFFDEKKENWNAFLDICTFAYNTSHQKLTFSTPFEVMFGDKWSSLLILMEKK